MIPPKPLSCILAGSNIPPLAPEPPHESLERVLAAALPEDPCDDTGEDY